MSHELYMFFDLSYVNENNNLHILKPLKSKGVISSAVAVYFYIIIEGVATALLPANNSFLFFLSFFFMPISLITSFLATWIIISILCDFFPRLSPACFACSKLAASAYINNS